MSGKSKLIYDDRKQITARLVGRMQEYRVVSGRDDKGTQETLGDVGYVHYLDHDDDPWAFTYAKTYQLIQFKCVLFIASVIHQ